MKLCRHHLVGGTAKTSAKSNQRSESSRGRRPSSSSARQLTPTSRPVGGHGGVAPCPLEGICRNMVGASTHQHRRNINGEASRAHREIIGILNRSTFCVADAHYSKQLPWWRQNMSHSRGYVNLGIKAVHQSSWRGPVMKRKRSHSLGSRRTGSKAVASGVASMHQHHLSPKSEASLSSEACPARHREASRIEAPKIKMKPITASAHGNHARMAS